MSLTWVALVGYYGMPFTSPPFELKRGDGSVLREWLRCPTTPQQFALRARIVLASAAGEGVREMARRLGTSAVTVCQWRSRYEQEGLAGIRTRPRSGRPRRISEAKERSVVAKTLTPERVNDFETPRVRILVLWRVEGRGAGIGRGAVSGANGVDPQVDPDALR